MFVQLRHHTTFLPEGKYGNDADVIDINSFSLLLPQRYAIVFETAKFIFQFIAKQL